MAAEAGYDSSFPEDTDRTQRKEKTCPRPSKLLVQAGMWSGARGVRFGCSSVGRQSQREKAPCNITPRSLGWEEAFLPEEGIGPGPEGVSQMDQAGQWEGVCGVTLPPGSCVHTGLQWSGVRRHIPYSTCPVHTY